MMKIIVSCRPTVYNSKGFPPGYFYAYLDNDVKNNLPGLLKHLQEIHTLEILPPLKLAKRFSEMVSTLELR